MFSKTKISIEIHNSAMNYHFVCHRVLGSFTLLIVKNNIERTNKFTLYDEQFSSHTVETFLFCEQFSNTAYRLKRLSILFVTVAINLYPASRATCTCVKRRARGFHARNSETVPRLAVLSFRRDQVENRWNTSSFQSHRDSAYRVRPKLQFR
mgnify:CR=1 FL=1